MELPYISEVIRARLERFYEKKIGNENELIRSITRFRMNQIGTHKIAYTNLKLFEQDIKK